MQANRAIVAILICFFSIVSICESQYWADNYYYSTIPLSFVLFIMSKELHKGNILTFMAKIGAKHSLGIYIIHPIIIDVFSFYKYGTNVMIMNPVSILFLSFIVVWFINLFHNYVSKHIIAKY